MSPPETMLGLLWAQFGPYHLARATALCRMSETIKVHPIELANRTHDYQWTRDALVLSQVTICPGCVTEHLSFVRVFLATRRRLSDMGLHVCLLPSYSPKQSLAALLAAKSLGIRTVMMNESHGGTARARGLSAVLKRYLVRMFDAALVGGQPQKRYFTSLGIPEKKIFMGYDAVDNDYFEAKAREIRNQEESLRSRYRLPKHYFLSLGRFVAKKNLSTLVRAFRLFLDASPQKQTHLLLVGSGDDEATLKSLCRDYRLPVYEKQQYGANGLIKDVRHPMANGASEIEPGVHFYGFRQIAETPVFYALAEAFVLPSLREEWGLVVNEAMASSLPVVVSETAGCAEDLLEKGQVEEVSRSELRSLLSEFALGTRIRRNGFVFDPNSSEELSRILLCLEASPELRSAMGKVSRRSVEKFSCDNFARNALRAAEAALDRGKKQEGESPLQVALGERR